MNEISNTITKSVPTSNNQKSPFSILGTLNNQNITPSITPSITPLLLLHLLLHLLHLITLIL